MPEESESVEQSRAKKPPRRRSAKRAPRSKLLALLAEFFPKITQVLQFALDWTRKKPPWLRGLVYALIGVAGVLYVFSDSVLKLPVVQDARESVASYVEDLFAVPLPVASGREFGIGVVRIEDDDDGSVAKSLVAALKLEGVERLQISRRLRFVDAAEPDAAEKAAHETARRWLDKSQADLMIWGQVLKADKPPIVRLIFTPRNAASAREAQASTNHLTFNFVEETREPFEAAVQAQVLALLGQNQPAHAAADQLTRAIARLVKVVEARVEGPGKAALVFALANARVTLGDQTGNTAELDQAIDAYETLLTDRLRHAAPNDWAMIQNMLGAALWIRGKAAREIALLERAERAYRRALDVYSAGKTPREWGFAHNGLGLVFESLASLDSRRERLAAAVEAYRTAVDSFRPTDAPAEWAMVQNNLGNALVSLGEYEVAPPRVQEAIALFRAALDVKVRAKAPLSWAMTQNNLGVALVTLGELESKPQHIELALAAYRAALEEYKSERTPLDWAMTQNNLGAALARLAETEEGTARLQEAATAFRRALEKRARERQPVAWATTQKNLANVLWLLAQRENSATRYHEAIAAYRAAREALKDANAPAEFAQVSDALGGALRDLGKREKRIDQIEEAVAIYREALEKIAELKSLRRYRTQVQNGLWQSEAVRAELLATRKQPPAPERL